MKRGVNNNGNNNGRGILVPWIIMGFSMGVGYYGMECLLSTYTRRRQEGEEGATKRRRRQIQRRRKNAMHERLILHVNQMKSLFTVSNAKAWLLRSWTFPVGFNYYDVFWGVFVAVLPRQEDEKDRAATARARKGIIQEELEVPSSSENDAFLSLPSQLNPRGGIPKSTSSSASGGKKQEQRFLEMLLHNVSHTDLVLGLDIIEKNTATTTNSPSFSFSSPKPTSSLNSMCLSRPRFSAFDIYCRKLLDALDSATSNQEQEHGEAEIVLVPQYHRSNDPRYTIVQPSDRSMVSTGFYWKNKKTTKSSSRPASSGGQGNDKDNNNKKLKNPRVIPLTEALRDLRVRGKDMAKKIDPYIMDSSSSSTLRQSMGTPTDMAASWNMVIPPTTAAADGKTTALPNKEDILVELKAVFFPLLATLLPRWHAQIDQKYNNNNNNNNNSNIHKVLVLVTGVGTPRNWTHSITGNSTEKLADLMELFLQKVYPDITVVKIHSDTNIFRYDDNISFVQKELMPKVNAYRDAHATQAPYPHEQQQQSPHWEDASFPLVPLEDGTTSTTRTSAATGGGLQPRQIVTTTSLGQGMTTTSYGSQPFDVDWKKSFAVTLSFADGSPARTHAIQTALRIYRPAYYHIWQLKTFWHERKIVDDDVEVHSFEEMETSPALESSDIALQSNDLASVVQEMKAFKEEMAETLLGKKESSDIHSFWLRKTHKPVLAVLLVQSPGDSPKLYRGTNMEVSMPTGSLCAERNVIGTALASNPKLRREDLKCIAVLAVPQPKNKTSAGSSAAATIPANGVVPRPPRSASIGSAGSDYGGSCRSSSRRNSWDDEAMNAHATSTGVMGSSSGHNNTATGTMTGRQMRSESFDEREEDWMLSYGDSQQHPPPPPPPPLQHSLKPPTTTLVETIATGNQQEPTTPMRQISLFSSESSNSLVDMIKQNPLGGSPPHHARGSSTSSIGTKEKRTVIVRSNNHDIDLNPLRPCGACHEWLKKIAECNPYFQIMTFTDADCNGVYVVPCQE